MTKKALVTGITGQDGSYMAQFLLQKGYKVYGAYRRASSANFWRLKSLGVADHPHLEYVCHDLTDQGSNIMLLKNHEVDEVYNLAAQSFVKESFNQPFATATITALGVLHLLEAIRIVNPKIKFYQASTSEMYGNISQEPQTEDTPMQPQNPYAVAKLYAHWLTNIYRDSYDMFAVSGILFNHESPLRGLDFVTRKITNGVAKIKLGKADILELGNLDAVRDWGYTPEYVEAMWKMLQLDEADNFVIATNEKATVRDFARVSFSYAGYELVFQGKGDQEIGVCSKTGKTLLRVNRKHHRPLETIALLGDYHKAHKSFGWKPKTTWKALAKIMLQADLERNKKNFSF